MSVYADLVSPVAKYASIVQHVLCLPGFKGWIPLLPSRLTLPLNFRNFNLMTILTWIKEGRKEGRIVNFFFVREKIKFKYGREGRENWSGRFIIFGLIRWKIEWGNISKGWYSEGATNRWTTRPSCKRVLLKSEEGSGALSRIGYRLTLMRASSTTIGGKVEMRREAWLTVDRVIWNKKST